MNFKDLKTRFILQDTRWFTYDSDTLCYKRVKQKTIIIAIMAISVGMMAILGLSNFIAYHEGVMITVEKYQDSLRDIRKHIGHITFNETYDYIGHENNNWDTIILRASNTYGVPFGIIKAVISVESSFNETAVSSAGAKGLMQIMPLNYNALNIEDPFNAYENVMGGTKMLCALYNKYNDWEKVFAFYNGGYSGLTNPSSETLEYIKNINKRIKKTTIVEKK